MTGRPRFNRRLVLGGGAAALAASGYFALRKQSGANHERVDIDTLHRGNGAEPRSLDPHFVSSAAEENIVGDMLVGLTTEDAGGRPIPGAADRWTVSADGKSWTFRLRKARWSDGVPVTAHDFSFAFERLLDPRTAAPYAYNLWVIRNARAVSEGKLPPTALGVEVPDDHALVIHLEHPAAYLPQLLLLPATKPLPRHTLHARADTGMPAGAYVCNGPYILKEWVPNDRVVLVRNPRFHDPARIKQVNFYPTEDSAAALRRLRAGELDTQNVIPTTEISWLRTHMKDALHVKPYLALAYVALNLRYPPLDDVRVRQALNLAYGREIVAERIFGLGEAPAYGYVPPGVANYPGGAAMDFKSLPYPARIARARQLMREAGYGPRHRLRLVYETSFNPDSRRMATVFQAMARQIDVDIDIESVDLPTHFRNLRQHQFQLGAAVWIADFDDAANFLELLRSGAGNNYAQYSNPRFDAALDAADQEADASKRGRLLLAAEEIALADYPWIVTRFPASEDLVQPYVKGWIDNARDVNRTRWLWLAK